MRRVGKTSVGRLLAGAAPAIEAVDVGTHTEAAYSLQPNEVMLGLRLHYPGLSTTLTRGPVRGATGSGAGSALITGADRRRYLAVAGDLLDVDGSLEERQWRGCHLSHEAWCEQPPIIIGHEWSTLAVRVGRVACVLLKTDTVVYDEDPFLARDDMGRPLRDDSFTVMDRQLQEAGLGGPRGSEQRRLLPHIW